MLWGGRPSGETRRAIRFPAFLFAPALSSMERWSNWDLASRNLRQTGSVDVFNVNKMQRLNFDFRRLESSTPRAKSIRADLSGQHDDASAPKSSRRCARPSGLDIALPRTATR